MSRAHRRSYCLLPPGASIDDLAAVACDLPGSHGHASFRELYGPIARDAILYEPGTSRIARDFCGRGGLLDEGSVEWLQYPKILRVVLPASAQAGGRIVLRDLAAKFGHHLAAALRRGEPWAQLMAADITGHVEILPDGQLRAYHMSEQRLTRQRELVTANAPDSAVPATRPPGVPALRSLVGSHRFGKRTLPFSI